MKVDLPKELRASYGSSQTNRKGLTNYTSDDADVVRGAANKTLTFNDGICRMID